tara:strand:+ start:8302 stop:8568 length:267 start_codon:yes stop_codon:yes gene_type:complete
MKNLRNQNREILFNRLEWDNDFEHVHTNNDGTDIFAIWLNDNDNRKEPTTPKGMMTRLGLLKEWSFLLNLSLVELVVDDRALIVNLLK